jgi:hypothetical protein
MALVRLASRSTGAKSVIADKAALLDRFRGTGPRITGSRSSDWLEIRQLPLNQL